MEGFSGVAPRKEKHINDPGTQVCVLDPLGQSVLYDHDHKFYSMDALEILRETIGILRLNLLEFSIIAAVLICPVSTVLLSNILVDQSIVKKVTVRLLLVAKSIGLPLNPYVKLYCQKFSETVVSSVMCFPLHITFSLLSKAAIVYSVDCTYSRKRFNATKFCTTVRKIWKRLVWTYMWVCMVISGCLTLFLLLFIAMGSLFSVIAFGPELIIYMAMGVGLLFSFVFANAIIICNIAVVSSVLEDISGPKALLWSNILIRGRIQVGLLIILGSTIGMALIECLFEHRVKTSSYEHESSRVWEGPLLVLMYSFVVLIDSMMSSVFYFSCRSYRVETMNDECGSVLEPVTWDM